MMSELSLKEILAPALRVLKDLGGSIVFSDESGQQFVIARKRDVEDTTHDSQMQFSLPSAKSVERAIRRNVPAEIGEDVMERINRDIALAHMREQEANDDFEIRNQKLEIRNQKLDNANQTLPPLERNNRPTPPPIRFEPIRGDLPPELQ